MRRDMMSSCGGEGRLCGPSVRSPRVSGRVALRGWPFTMMLFSLSHRVSFWNIWASSRSGERIDETSESRRVSLLDSAIFGNYRLRCPNKARPIAMR